MTNNKVLCIAPRDDKREAQAEIVDLFCGGGGSGTGILDAFERLGQCVSGTFINHSEQAIELHEANHPEHTHLRSDLLEIEPSDVYEKGSNINLLWASPECTHHSIARGGKPINDQSRSTAQCVVSWAKWTKPTVILVENVKEFASWGPLRPKLDKTNGKPMWEYKVKSANGRLVTKLTTEIPLKRLRGESKKSFLSRLAEISYAPALEADPARKGEIFKKWFAKIERLGYRGDHRILCSADFGDPTTRKRLFCQFVRKDSELEIVWPNPTHAKVPGENQLPWRTAREIIDWSDRGASIFTRKRPLSSKTLRRIAIGLVKYGLKDFFVPEDQGWDKSNVRGVDEPVSTITTNHRGEGLASPYVIRYEGQSDAETVDGPLSTITCKPKHYVIDPNLVKLKGTEDGKDVDLPLGTVCAGGFHHALVEAFMMATDQAGKDGVNDNTYPANSPVHTATTKQNQAVIEPSMVELTSAVMQVARGDMKPEDSIRRVQDGNEPVDALNGGGSYAVMRPYVSEELDEKDSRIQDLLQPLVEETMKRKQVELQPWIYTYYSSGSEGADIDNPTPTSTTKARLGVCYPAVKFDGKFYILDIYFRMLQPRELARAMGLPEDYQFTGTKTQQVRAIGNMVSIGVARALTLAVQTQNPDIMQYNDEH
jgi:DNA (cytosine-5)-methyltransferase 1